MSEIPDTPEECPICQRIEARIHSLDSLRGKLSDSEIENLITEVQNAVLKKNDITRGNKMSDEKIVLNKANFDELYEAQKYILLLVEKMANRMEKHDAILASYGAQLADVMMKAEDLGASLGSLDVGEGSVPVDDPLAGGNTCTPGCTVAGGEEAAGGAPAGEELPMDAGASKMQMSMKNNEYQAGYNAAMADAMKKNGVPTNASFQYPEFGGKRTVSAQDAKAAQASMEKSLSMKDLAEMTPTALNAELKKRGLL